MNTQRLAWRLCLLLIGLAAAFVLLSVHAPAFMAAPVASGSVLSRGVVLGVANIVVVIGAALYFEHRLNAEAQVRREAE